MKKIIALIGPLVGMFGGTSAFSMPAPTEITNCWDHTFAYTSIQVEQADDLMIFRVSGQDLSVFSGISANPTDNWAHGELSLIVKADQCRVEKVGLQNLVSCFTGTGQTASLRIESTEGQPATEIIPLEYAQIETVKVRRAALPGKNPNTLQFQINHRRVSRKSLLMVDFPMIGEKCDPSPFNARD